MPTEQRAQALPLEHQQPQENLPWTIRKLPQQEDTPSTPVAPAPVPSEPANRSADVNAAIEAMRTAHAAELERIGAIRQIYSGALPQFGGSCNPRRLDVEKAELEKIRATRPAVPAIHVQQNTINSNVLEAACFLAAVSRTSRKWLMPNRLIWQARRFRGGIGLQELLLEAAWANGYSGRNFRDHRAVMRLRFGSSVEASGVSTIEHRWHPLQRGEQIPARWLIQRRTDLAQTSVRFATSRTSRP